MQSWLERGASCFFAEFEIKAAAEWNRDDHDVAMREAELYLSTAIPAYISKESF